REMPGVRRDVGPVGLHVWGGGGKSGVESSGARRGLGGGRHRAENQEKDGRRSVFPRILRKREVWAGFGANSGVFGAERGSASAGRRFAGGADGRLVRRISPVIHLESASNCLCNT